MAIRLSDDILEFVGRPNTSGFLIAARAFVELLESNAIDKNVFFIESHTKLLELDFAGFKLDTVEAARLRRIPQLIKAKQFSFFRLII